MACLLNFIWFAYALSLCYIQVSFPAMLRKTPFSRLWYKPDTMFFTPKVYIKMDFHCPLSQSSPKSAVLTDVFTRLLMDYLNDYGMSDSDVCFYGSSKFQQKLINFFQCILSLVSHIIYHGYIILDTSCIRYQKWELWKKNSYWNVLAIIHMPVYQLIQSVKEIKKSHKMPIWDAREMSFTNFIPCP